MTNDKAATKFLVQDLDLYYGKFQALKKINLEDYRSYRPFRLR